MDSVQGYHAVIYATVCAGSQQDFRDEKMT